MIYYPLIPLGKIRLLFKKINIFEKTYSILEQKTLLFFLGYKAPVIWVWRGQVFVWGV